MSGPRRRHVLPNAEEPPVIVTPRRPCLPTGTLQARVNRRWLHHLVRRRRRPSGGGAPRLDRTKRKAPFLGFLQVSFIPRCLAARVSRPFSVRWFSPSCSMISPPTPPCSTMESIISRYRPRSSPAGARCERRSSSLRTLTSCGTVNTSTVYHRSHRSTSASVNAIPSLAICPISDVLRTYSHRCARYRCCA